MIPGSSAWAPSPSTALLVLLVTGHLLADFLLQTRADVDAKRRGSGYASHGIRVFLAQLAVLLPLLSLRVALVAAAIAVLHVGIDWGKSRLMPGNRSVLVPFVLDQLLHLLVLVGGWRILESAGPISAFRWLSPGEMGTYLGGVILLSAFALNATGGSVIVEGVLEILTDVEGGEAGTDGATDDEEAAGYEGAGRVIGILERTLALGLVLYGQWATVALLVTAKSIARFEELKERRFAEYYLAGTLASLLVALALGFALKEGLFPLLG